MKRRTSTRAEVSEPIVVESTSQEVDTVDATEAETDAPSFDMAALASKITSSLAQRLHADSSLFAAPLTSARQSKSSDIWSPPAPVDATTKQTERKLELVQRRGVFELPQSVTASRISGQKAITDDPKFLAAATAPLVGARIAKKQASAEAKEKAGKSAGSNWFHMTAPQITPEIKNDLKMLALRSALDPKRHYKQDKSLTKAPKFFHVGTVIAGAAETFSARLPKAQRRPRLVDEVMADAKSRSYVKRRFLQIQESKQQDAGKRRFKNTGDKRRKTQ